MANLSRYGGVTQEQFHCDRQKEIHNRAKRTASSVSLGYKRLCKVQPAEKMSLKTHKGSFDELQKTHLKLIRKQKQDSIKSVLC